MNIPMLNRTQNFIIWLGILPLLLAAGAYRTNSQNIKAVAATLSTNEFIQRLDELLSTVQDAETGQRGYILTGKQQYLQPFVDAEARLAERLSALDRLCKTNGVDRSEERQLGGLVHDKMSELSQTIALKKQGKAALAVALIDTDRGQRDMAAIRALISKLKGDQRNAFSERVAMQRQSQRALEWLLAIGVTISLFLVYLAYRFSVSYQQKRDQVEAEIRLLNETLEQRVKDRTAELEARTEQLEARSVDLQRSNADLLQFAYVASHDLQEPLRMVGSYMGLLSHRYQSQLDDSANKYIQFAIDGANRMQALILDLLTYSRVGTQAVRKQSIPLEQVVQKALQNLQVAISESDAAIEYTGLPDVQADETKLIQVVQNLVGNAVKFRSPERPPKLTISSRLSGREWLITIADNGIGFDPKYTDRIFQVFQRLHAVGRYPGNGIGLAVCRRIIEHHGGRLWAESQEGEGAKFFFTLPTRVTAERDNWNQMDEVRRFAGHA